jgi:hypothetical protein
MGGAEPSASEPEWALEIPMGSNTRVQGTTVLYFALDQVGPAPWRLSATIAEDEPGGRDRAPSR